MAVLSPSTTCRVLFHDNVLAPFVFVLARRRRAVATGLSVSRYGLFTDENIRVMSCHLSMNNTDNMRGARNHAREAVKKEVGRLVSADAVLHLRQACPSER